MNVIPLYQAARPDQPAWFARASCANHPNPDLWFPERGADQREAKRICATCPVRSECADYGLTQRHGIWGGLSERERRRVRRTRGHITATCPECGDQFDAPFGGPRPVYCGDVCRLIVRRRRHIESRQRRSR